MPCKAGVCKPQLKEKLVILQLTVIRGHSYKSKEARVVTDALVGIRQENQWFGV